jgi:hypothetical protein
VNSIQTQIGTTAKKKQSPQPYQIRLKMISLIRLLSTYLAGAGRGSPDFFQLAWLSLDFFQLTWLALDEDHRVAMWYEDHPTNSNITFSGIYVDFKTRRNKS